MRLNRTSVQFALLVAGAALVASGCGGGDSGGSSPSPRAGRTVTTFDAHTRVPTAPQRRVEPKPAPRPSPRPSRRAAVPRPAIVARPIPFGPKRRAETAAYAQRHYGLATYRLHDPHVIVEHFTATPDFRSTYDTFAADVPDVELHELPATCAHFVVDTDGTIYQLVPTTIICRHTVGLNWTAIGIEHVGRSDAQVLGDTRQLDASLRLTRWLRCRYGIRVGDVIGHNESLSSPYHRERVARLRTQTHGDMAHASMEVYRSKLGALGGCG
jgi:N-acetylmuramoyl-L-alanine amidase